MITLVKFEKEDFDRLIGWVKTEEEMIQFGGAAFKFPITHEQLEKYISTENRYIFKVIENSTNQVIGHAELNNVDHKNLNARICRVLIGEKENRGKGYGKMIINQLVNFAFNELKFHRVDLGVFDFNQSAIKCYQKCGFEIEGHFRDVYRVGEVYWSTYNMSRINSN